VRKISLLCPEEKTCWLSGRRDGRIRAWCEKTTICWVYGVSFKEERWEGRVSIGSSIEEEKKREKKVSRKTRGRKTRRIENVKKKKKLGRSNRSL